MTICYKNNVKSNDYTFTFISSNVLVKFTRTSLLKKRCYYNVFFSEILQKQCTYQTGAQLKSALRHHLGYEHSVSRASASV